MIKSRQLTTDNGQLTTPPAAPRGAERRGFTLIELLVVMVIIAIIISFVLIAAMDAARRAEERATQSLITKLEGGLNDRLDALMTVRPDPNFAHAYMASVWSTAAVTGNNPLGMIPLGNSLATQTQRAQVFAWYDYLKRELPDVFFLTNDQNYPINFAGQAFPGTTTLSPSAIAAYVPFFLPLGNTVDNNPGNSFGDLSTTIIPTGGSMIAPSNPSLGFTGAGIFGASYANAAAIFKNLPGANPKGFDGVDNNGNSLIDELLEGQWNNAILHANHTHSTARSEMLYAILVEGNGPWGSVFNRDEFTDREVQDTDGDGLPEFVDAWGQPLQFFRWPLLYHSDIQRGQIILPDPTTPNTWDLLPPYQRFNSANATVNLEGGSVFQERERDPLDPNQQLTAPQWWSKTGVQGQLAANNNFNLVAGPAGNSPVKASGGVQAFEYFFHRLTEPLTPGTGATFWDRGGGQIGIPRRAYYSKFLILSGGRDKQPGVFLYSDADMLAMGANAASFLIANENNAMPFGLDLVGGTIAGFTTTVTISTNAFSNVTSTDPSHPSSYDLQQSAQDDISNQNLQSVSGIGGSG